MYANFCLAMIATLSTVKGADLDISMFQQLGCRTEDSLFLTAVVNENMPAVQAALLMGYEPDEGAKARLAMVQRHGTVFGRRVANIIANRVAARTWHPGYAPTPADEALLDCRDLQCA
jgi:hypothetical protein